MRLVEPEFVAQKNAPDWLGLARDTSARQRRHQKPVRPGVSLQIYVNTEHHIKD